MSESPNLQLRDRAEIVAERAAVEARIASLNDRAETIIQNMILIIGTGILAATQYRPAFVVSPILWSVWLLFAQQTDRETRKLTEYSRWLEGRLFDLEQDEETPNPSLVLRSAIPRLQTNRSDALLFGIPPVFAILIEISMAVLTAWFLVDDGLAWLAALFVAWICFVLVALAYIASKGDSASTEYADRLQEFTFEREADGSRRLTGGPSGPG